MKTQPRYTKDALREQLVLAANRIIAQAYDIDLFKWDANNKRTRGHLRLETVVLLLWSAAWFAVVIAALSGLSA